MCSNLTHAFAYSISYCLSFIHSLFSLWILTEFFFSMFQVFISMCCTCRKLPTWRHYYSSPGLLLCLVDFFCVSCDEPRFYWNLNRLLIIGFVRFFPSSSFFPPWNECEYNFDVFIPKIISFFRIKKMNTNGIFLGVISRILTSQNDTAAKFYFFVTIDVKNSKFFGEWVSVFKQQLNLW